MEKEQEFDNKICILCEHYDCRYCSFHETVVEPDSTCGKFEEME